jgi:DNA-directed RNA polymerase specialized sigma24 family protein
VSLETATCRFNKWGVYRLSTQHKLHSDSFTRFVKEMSPRLEHALVARYGLDLGQESAAEAFAYAWEHWEKVEQMANPVGYLYRTATSRSRRIRRPTPVLPQIAQGSPIWVEPGLPAALERLSTNQRTAVMLVYSFEYTHSEAADVMGIKGGTLRKHLTRGMAKLRSDLEVQVDS